MAGVIKDHATGAPVGSAPVAVPAGGSSDCAGMGRRNADQRHAGQRHSVGDELLCPHERACRADRGDHGRHPRRRTGGGRGGGADPALAHRVRHAGGAAPRQSARFGRSDADDSRDRQVAEQSEPQFSQGPPTRAGRRRAGDGDLAMGPVAAAGLGRRSARGQRDSRGRFQVGGVERDRLPQRRSRRSRGADAGGGQRDDRPRREAVCPARTTDRRQPGPRRRRAPGRPSDDPGNLDSGPVLALYRKQRRRRSKTPRRRSRGSSRYRGESASIACWSTPCSRTWR